MFSCSSLQFNIGYVVVTFFPGKLQQILVAIFDPNYKMPFHNTLFTINSPSFPS